VRRRLFAFASALSLPLCITTLSLCLISTLRPMRWSRTLDYVPFHEGGPVFQRHRSVGISNGVLYTQDVNRGTLNPWEPIKSVIPGYPVAYRIRTIVGFSLIRETAPLWSYREWAIPLWPIALASAILPMRAYLRRRRAKRVGFCPRCSYNLTGNTSGVCSECGTIIESQPVSGGIPDTSN
jgi:hypothetical protein